MAAGGYLSGVPSRSARSQLSAGPLGRTKTLDSKTVNAQIRSELRPFLKELGFTRFTSRSAWRYDGSKVDVLNFQSFNAYNASVMGCTTYSFAVNLGCYFADIPYQYEESRIKEERGQLLPAEYECPFRGRLRRSFSQPKYLSREIWFIDPAGRYLEKAVHDVRIAIARVGVPWFGRLADPNEALRVLLEEDESMGELWGFGRNPSPIRHYLAGYFALKLGENGLARQHLSEALASGCFKQVAERIERDVQRAA